MEGGISVAAATVLRMENIYPVLRTCSFFDGIPEEKYPNVLTCLRARRQCFTKGSSIMNIGDHSTLAGLMLQGSVEVSLLDENGNQINVNHIARGEGFGMAMACSQQEACPIRLQAITDCEVLFLDFTNVLDPDAPFCPFRNRVAANLLRDMARQTIFLNRRLRIMGQKRLRDKIKVYLQYQRTQPDGTIHIPFKRNEWADFLYADRSALSRELGRMADEGILEVQGHQLRILDADFLKN